MRERRQCAGAVLLLLAPPSRTRPPGPLRASTPPRGVTGRGGSVGGEDSGAQGGRVVAMDA